MKNVLVISTSLRPNSNSDALARAFERGAKEAGHQVEYVSLRGKKLSFCLGCMQCMETNRCVIKDDAPAIVERVKGADVLVFATPIYYYEMSGQMKVLLDRCNPIFTDSYAFRDVYLLATSAEDEDRAMDGAVKGLEGWIECFEQARLAGILRGTGLSDRGEAAKHPELLERAAAMGRGV